MHHGPHDQWKFLPFFKGYWQVPCTAITTGKYLLFVLCKETVKESPTGPLSFHFLLGKPHVTGMSPNLTDGHTTGHPSTDLNLTSDLGLTKWLLLFTKVKKILIFPCTQSLGRQYVHHFSFKVWKWFFIIIFTQNLLILVSLFICNTKQSNHSDMYNYN